MNPAVKITVALLITGIAALSVSAEFRFPMPEFDSGYQHPALSIPAPSLNSPLLDVAVLAGCLSLAAWLAIRRRSRSGLLALTVFSLLYFGFWRKGCVCSVGSLQNVLAAVLSSDFPLPWPVLAFFILPLLFALFFGRVFCASVCPLGAVQELAALRPLQLPKPIEEVLRLIPYLYLGVTVLSLVMGSGFLICRYDPFVEFFRQGAGFNMFLLGGLFLLAGVFIGRPYCRFFCPYGVLLGWMSRFSKWHVQITPAQCTQCRLCETACPYGAIKIPMPAEEPLPRREGTRRLRNVLFLTPVIILFSAGVGWMSHDFWARLHPTVQLAERIAAEERGEYTDMTIESETFRGEKTTIPQLFAEADGIRRRFQYGSAWLGVFMGLVICGKVMRLSVLRRAADYEADRFHCVSCARCFAYCPVEKEVSHAS